MSVMLARMELVMMPKKQTLVTGALVKPDDNIAVTRKQRDLSTRSLRTRILRKGFPASWVVV